MAKLKRAALKSHKERHESWQKYAEGELKKGNKPVAFKHWRADLKQKPKKETESTYFRGIKRETTESRLKAAGMTTEQIGRLKRKKR